MKKILSIVAVLAVAVFSAQAQYQSVTLFESVTNAATGGTNVAKVIYAPKQDTVAVAFTPYFSAAGGTNAFAYARSVDGTKYEAYTVVPYNGITAGQNATVITEIDLNGAAFVKVGFVTNWFTAAVMTNSLFTYGVKVLP